MRRSLLVFVVVGLGAITAPALAQTGTTSGEFAYSPEAQQRGGSVQITGKCVVEGTTDNVDMIVSVREGADGQGNYGFSKAFTPTSNGAISGTIEVPGDTPFGDYTISGACRNGPNTFFSKSGPFRVGDRATATTTTTAVGVTTTSSTTTSTAPDATTTTTEVGVVAVPGTIDDDSDDETTGTTIDEFAGTRNEDDDSIGPLLLLFGAVPLLLAVVAVGLAMRRRGATPDAPPAE